MNLETVTRPMEMFRDQMLRLGVQWAKQGRYVSRAALRNSAHALTLTAARLGTLADRLDDAPTLSEATPAEATPAEATPAEATTAEATTAEEVHAEATTAEATTAAEVHAGSKKKHRRNHAAS